MAVFQYKAIQGNGAIAEGEIEAGGRQDALRQMEGRGLRPIRLAERRNGKADPSAKPASASSAPESGLKLSLGGKKITARILENFTRLLASLLAAGVPLSRALVILQKEA